MGATFTPIAALLLSAAILLMGNGLQSTLLPLRAEIEAFSTFNIGVLGSTYYIGFAAGCIWAPRLVLRVGHIRTFTDMVAIASVAPLVHNILPSAVLWWLVRAVTGFCLAALFMIIESWLNEKATNENRGVVFSAYTIISLTVVTLGQLMINLSEPGSFIPFSLAAILVSLAAVPISLTRASSPAPVQTVKIRIRYLYRLSPVGVIGALLVGAQQGAFWALGPIFAVRIGFDIFEITIFMSAAVIGGALGVWPLGKLSDRLDRRKVLLGACFSAAVVGLAIRVLYPTLGSGVLILSMLWGMSAFPLYSICAAHLNDHVEGGGFVEASSGLLLTFAAGAIAGPIIVSPFMTLITPYALFGWMAFFEIALAVFIVYRMRIREAVSEARRSSFVDALNKIQTVLPIPTSTTDDQATGATDELSPAAKDER